MAKSKEKLKARELRAKGESIKSIAKKLRVSSSTASLWCRDIKLSQEQIKTLEQHSKDPNYGKRLAYSLKQQAERSKKIQILKETGVKEIGNLSKRELFLVGVSLYWAEGFKKDSQAGFASSDPNMINIFLKWLTDCLNYSTQDLSLRVTSNISHQYRIMDIQNYWSTITKISIKNFQKPFYQKVKWNKIYENPENYHGVLRVKVRKSTDLLRKIQGWIEGLSNNT
ncbi:hypothetical protein C4577_00090 [Candidatus Parcubacteria bacterium]|nr:MAG: hypothetical protein C4577_00090 [Candidatus Parcubacteria bacterium]